MRHAVMHVPFMKRRKVKVTCATANPITSMTNIYRRINRGTILCGQSIKSNQTRAEELPFAVSLCFRCFGLFTTALDAVRTDNQMLGAESFVGRQDDSRPKDGHEELMNERRESDRHIEDQCENETEISEDSWFISNELSEGLVLFSSDEGKKVFFETANAGYLNSYFELAQNFLTSFEPRFSCALATLTMCLNTFREDPCRVWKDIYRWYTQTMLEHCVPYRIIEGNGIVFQQFACMAEANYLKVALVCNLKPTASIEEFRALCKRTTSGPCDEILVVCYHRIGLDQEGTGHYSPIGGYHPEKDLVLVFDISRYKYPPHWVPVKRLWEAMALNDNVTGNPRGYFVLRKRTTLDKPSLLFKAVSSEDSPTFHKGWLKFFKTALLPWHYWMKSLNVQGVNTSVMLRDVVRTLLQFMMSSNCTGIEHLDGIHIRLEFKNADPSLDKKCLVCEVRETIENCILWEYVIEQIVEQELKERQQQQPQEHEQQQQQQHLRHKQPHQQHNHHHHQHQHQHNHQQTCLCWSKLINQVSEHQLPESTMMCCDMNIQPSSCHLRRFNLAHYIVMILLSWPYDLNNKNGHKISTGICFAMHNVISTELFNMNEVLKDEVANVRNRFQKTQFAVQ